MKPCFCETPLYSRQSLDYAPHVRGELTGVLNGLLHQRRLPQTTQSASFDGLSPNSDEVTRVDRRHSAVTQPRDRREDAFAEAFRESAANKNHHELVLRKPVYKTFNGGRDFLTSIHHHLFITS